MNEITTLDTHGRFRKFFSALAFYVLLLLSIVLLAFLAAVILGYVPVKEQI